MKSLWILTLFAGLLAGLSGCAGTTVVATNRRPHYYRPYYYDPYYGYGYGPAYYPPPAVVVRPQRTVFVDRPGRGYRQATPVVRGPVTRPGSNYPNGPGNGQVRGRGR